MTLFAEAVERAARAMPRMKLANTNAGIAALIIEGPTTAYYADPVFQDRVEATVWMQKYQAQAAIIAFLEHIIERGPDDGMKFVGGMIPDAFKGTVAARGNADRVFRAMLTALLKQREGK